MITIEDFKKIDLKVAKIVEAERVEGSDKLLKLKVDIGEEQRQIIAGIGKSYQPEDLVLKKIIIVANLEPRNLMGMESNGMLLAANDDNGSIILVPEKDVPSGTGIR
ncbi:MAG: methionine--tRNA ligase subunit beta [Candidatus Yanofskybacteria bacterium CG10_big_fil_rev_8_21_14_0_10_37_15]|uniref:Methionine--tRNA ligase n=1 Tax=Candidatus Yanofskybacteria bacterium CG10_big_fil_rev_8_21_14_0_10_37_15 TaxID=1975097 RepID=A0A2H0R6M7_9BACT|nr:MAG: methionine--tRNA ligase subunit beta [Candidatus Yanofskybacteria bacterium CG10_big_fil_rev_8_21_14_0_10_37_15]